MVRLTTASLSTLAEAVAAAAAVKTDATAEVAVVETDTSVQCLMFNVSCFSLLLFHVTASSH